MCIKVLKLKKNNFHVFLEALVPDLHWQDFFPILFISLPVYSKRCEVPVLQVSKLNSFVRRAKNATTMCAISLSLSLLPSHLHHIHTYIHT